MISGCTDASSSTTTELTTTIAQGIANGIGFGSGGGEKVVEVVVRVVSYTPPLLLLGALLVVFLMPVYPRCGYCGSCCGGACTF